MGRMEEVVEDEDSAIVYYLPHHGVYRQESKTTPLRVVFNASSITTSGESLTTVTYGTKSAPYLATRSLKQLVIDDADKYPLAAEVIMSDVYMDDLTGADDLESGRKLQVQLFSMLKGAGMELHKWSASNPLLLPDSMCQVKDLSYSSTETKTLGPLWKPHPDSFALKISPTTSKCDNLIVTKKSVISTIARIFDPLGLIGPVITRAKILLQSLWQLKLDWNDPLPSNLVSYWKSFIDALESINYLDIPRYCLQDKSIRTELHGFSDSSEKAYGAALYLRCINTSAEISVRLLCSKSKVAPLKSITIPRLELCGAVLLSKLLKRTLDAFKVNISQIYLWTDSSIVLAWIKKPLAQLKTFVRNRVSIIQELTESDFWKHVNSENNPADILSRGAETTLTNIRNSFWIPSARNVVRKILRTCITCRKVSAKGSQQLMADLPAARVTACRVFSQVDNCNESVRNLTVLGLEINQLSELIIINHCSSKLHEEIAHRWELTLKPDTYPTLQAFRMFIESEARALGLLSGNADAPKSKLGTNLLEGMPIFGPAGTPTDIPTKLGYILSGKIYAPPLKESIVNSSLNDQLSELWKLEEVPKTNAKIQIPDPCEESFSKSVKREIMKVDILLIFPLKKIILSAKAKKRPYNYCMP
ncbi:integrase_H2C2 domain-containing protein [Trichonephila clavipes]|nr:integrase_H2C2 domain-containing protein [Trichonephila clavipes]